LKKGKIENWKLKIENWSPNLVMRRYMSSGGVEYFISFEDQLGYLYWFTRLLLPTDPVDIKWLGKNTAIIRELHIYGNLKNLTKSWKIWTLLSDISGCSSDLSAIQHTWFWKQLMDIAEQIAKWANYKKLSVISGIWVRAYYRKLGYMLEWSYMVKKI
jgi:elongator complex protein 3